MREDLISRRHNFDGFFYPKGYSEIIFSIQNFFQQIVSFKHDVELLNIVRGYINKKRIFSFIVPHGAYQFSGYVSSFVYYLIQTIDCHNFIILSSDHNGTSPGVSIMDKGFWTTPLGKVQINESMALNLLKNNIDDLIHVDPFSFSIDHTIEIHLPFLQFIKKDFLFLPILLKVQDRDHSIKLARMLYSILPEDEMVILISTSNLSHYLNLEECYRYDKSLISAILSLDVDYFYRKIQNYISTVCGYGCIASTMAFSKMIGNLDTILLKYLTSGDIDGNKSSVVGYSSMIMI